MNYKTLENVKTYIEMMEQEEYKAGHYKLAADLRRLLNLLEETKPTNK
jgi:hypothetical protein